MYTSIHMGCDDYYVCISRKNNNNKTRESRVCVGAVLEYIFIIRYKIHAHARCRQWSKNKIDYKIARLHTTF